MFSMSGAPKYLQVGKNGNGVIVLLLNLTDQPHELLLFMVLSVREIQPEDVCA